MNPSHSNKFRLFKRSDAGTEMAATEAGYKDRPYYFRFVHRGKAYPRCLETPNATEAQRRAKAKYAEIVAAVSSGDYRRLDATRLRTTLSATIEQLFSRYRTSPAEASASTRRANECSLRLVVAGAAHLHDLTPELIRAYFETISTKVLDLEDQCQIASLKRSANSRWLQARSIFTEKCIDYYLDKELIVNRAGLDAFIRSGNLAMFTRIPKQNYNPPSEDIIRRTLEAWESLGSVSLSAAGGEGRGEVAQNRDLFVAIGHELAFGLRKGEMAQACWNWHTERNGYPILDGRAEVKNGSGLIQVRALDPFYSTMKRICEDRKWWGTGNLPVIAGTATYCDDGLYRAVSDWLRALGWNTNKTNHALRAYAGSQVAMRYGIYEAQMFLRHSTVKVTEQNYSHFVSKFKPQDLDSIPARWAIVT